MKLLDRLTWASGIVTGIFDPWGHDIAVWIPSFASIGAASASPPLPFELPLPSVADYIIGGDFEEGLTSWSVTGTLESGVAKATLETGANRYKGTASLRLRSGTAPATSLYQKGDTPYAGGKVRVMRVTPGMQLQATGWFRWETTPGGLSSGNVAVDYLDDSFAFLSASFILVWGVGVGTTWTQHSAAVTVPSTAHYIAVSVETVRDLGGGEVIGLYDDLHLEANGLTNWQVDGSGNLNADTSTGGVVRSRVGAAAAIAGPPLILSHTGNTSTSSVSEVSVTSFSLPANALALNGQAVRLTAIGRVTGTGNGTVRLKFGATQIAQVPLIAAGGQFKLEMTIVRTGAATQQATGTSLDSSNGTVLYSAAPGETLSGAVTVDFRALVSVGTATLTYDSASVEHLSA